MTMLGGCGILASPSLATAENRVVNPSSVGASGLRASIRHPIPPAPATSTQAFALQGLPRDDLFP